MVTELSSVLLTSALEVPALPHDFLWPPHVAIGRVTAVLDTTSSTTSVLTSYLAATASAGATFPLCHQTRQATNVVVIAGNRAIRNSIRSQLDVFGGDLAKVKFLHGVDGKLGARNFSPAEQRHQLEAAVLATLPELVAIEVRFKTVSEDSKGIFSCLARDARRMEMAIVVVVPAKKHGPKEIDRTVRILTHIKSVGALCVVRRDRSGERFLFKSEKSITRHDIPALSFQLEPTTTHYDMPAVRLTWDARPVQPSASDAPDCKQENETRVPVDDLHDGATADTRQGAPRIARRVKPHRRRSLSRKAVKLETAMRFLRETLANGPVPTSELKQLAEEANITGITLRRAGENLRLVKKGGRWRLPQ